MRQPIHLHNEIERLKSLIDHRENYELQRQTADLTYAYHTMLQMFANGVNDPKQNEIYDQLCLQCATLITKAERYTRLQKERHTLYVKTAGRTHATSPIETMLSQLEDTDQAIHVRQYVADQDLTDDDLDRLISQRETLRNEIFARTWTADLWEQTDLELYRDFFSNKKALYEDLLLVMSAITLSLTEYADEKKLELLVWVYRHDMGDRMDARIMAAFVILLYIEQKIDAYRYDIVRKRFAEIMQDSKAPQDLYDTVTACLFTSDTTETTAQIDNALLPIMREEYLKQDTEEDYESFMLNQKERDVRESNPEARKIMQRLDMLHKDGADTSYNAFLTMKDYGFLNELAHWFAPFELRQATIWAMRRELSPRTVRNIYLQMYSSDMCPIDKYKLMISLSKEPQLIDKMGDLLPLNVESGMTTFEQIIPSQSRRTSTMRQTVYALWRFFSFHPEHTDIPWCRQPDQPPVPTDIVPEIAAYIATSRTFEPHTQNLMDFLVRYKKYRQAQTLADACLQSPAYAEDPAFNLLAAQVYLAQKQAKKAEKCLYIAYGSGIEPRTTLELLAQTATLNKNYSDATSFYAMLLEEDPENREWLKAKATCHAEAGETQKAIQALYGLCYLDNGSGASRLALAKLLFKDLQYDKALEQLKLYTPDTPGGSEEEEACLLEGLALVALDRRTAAIHTLTRAYAINQALLKKDSRHRPFADQADQRLACMTDPDLLYRAEYILDIVTVQASQEP